MLSRDAHIGDALMVVVCISVVITVAAGCVFIAYATWAALPLIMATVIGMATIVVASVVRALEIEEPDVLPEPEAVRPRRAGVLEVAAVR
jgi:hypothetical protein